MNQQSSLPNTIGKLELFEHFSEWAELLAKEFGWDFAEHIPLIGRVFKTASLFQKCKENSTFNKLRAFIKEIDCIEERERERLISIFNNDKNKDAISSLLIQAIDKFDEEQKATILSKIFLDYLRESLSRETFIELRHALVNSFFEDLSHLANYSTASTEYPARAWRLLSIGLLLNEGIDGGDAYGLSGGTLFRRSELGDTMLKYLDVDAK